MVGLDPGELEEQGFMDGFASVLTNLQNPSDVKADSDATKDQQRRAKIRMLREQARARLWRAAALHSVCLAYQALGPASLIGHTAPA